MAPKLPPGEIIVPKGQPFDHFSLLLPSGEIVGSCLSTPHSLLAEDRLREDTGEKRGSVVRIAYTDKPNYWSSLWSQVCE